MRPEFSLELLKAFVTYYPETGRFFWNDYVDIKWFAHSKWPEGTHKMFITKFCGKEAFIREHHSGYYHGTISGKDEATHRLAWYYVHGKFPNGEIDHINGIKKDNRIVNLRDVPRSVNSKNQKRRKNNKSGYTGVTKIHDSKWRGKVTDNYKDYILYFKTKAEAIEWVKNKRKEIKDFTERHGRD